jgi:hypothetical protein
MRFSPRLNDFPQTWSINSTQEVIAAFLWKVAALGQSANSLVKQPAHVEAAHVVERHRAVWFVRAGHRRAFYSRPRRCGNRAWRGGRLSIIGSSRLPDVLGLDRWCRAASCRACCWAAAARAWGTRVTSEAPALPKLLLSRGRGCVRLRLGSLTQRANVGHEKAGH